MSWRAYTMKKNESICSSIRIDGEMQGSLNGKAADRLSEDTRIVP